MSETRTFGFDHRTDGAPGATTERAGLAVLVMLLPSIVVRVLRLRWARVGLAVLVMLLCAPASAQAQVGDETQFIFNTFSFLIWGGLVMWMAAGFTMLESGSVRTKNAAIICLKNIGLYSIAGIAFYVIGYNLMYTNVQG